MIKISEKLTREVMSSSTLDSKFPNPIFLSWCFFYWADGNSILFRLIWLPTLWNMTAHYISNPFFPFPSKHQLPAIPSSNTYHLRSLTAQFRILDWKFTGWGIVYAQQIFRLILKLRGKKYSMVYINGFWSFISEVYISEIDIAWKQPKN